MTTTNTVTQTYSGKPTLQAKLTRVTPRLSPHDIPPTTVTPRPSPPPYFPMAPLHHLLPLLLTILPSTLASCALKCSNHGTCNTFSQCVCHTGFAGAACEERLCPFDLAFADSATADDSAHATAECSNRGHCDRATGLCTCMEGFTGKACHRTECPSQCNSRGRCVNLNEKAATTRNSDSVRYTYEGVWDAEKIYGCLCDDGYEGYDCS